jgi:hypothetical protein
MKKQKDQCLPNESRYLRVVNKGRNPLESSIESWDRVIQSGWFENDENIMRYYKERIYPDLPKGIESLDEFVLNIQEKAEKSYKNVNIRKEVMKMVESVEPYTLKENKELGFYLEADGVNVNPSQGISFYGSGIKNFDTYELTGNVIGENIMKDGLILKNPKICKKL